MFYLKEKNYVLVLVKEYGGVVVEVGRKMGCPGARHSAASFLNFVEPTAEMLYCSFMPHSVLRLF